MKTGIRIIKRGAGVNTNDLSANQTEKSVWKREREAANTVKSWVAEWAERKRLLDRATLSLVRSLEPSR